MIVELTFAAGRFHATPWGRHVNEGVAEWPPSPFRFLRALLDVWYRKHPEIPAEVVETLLGALAAKPPHFLLPRARASHTRSYLAQWSEDPADKKLVFDGFVVLDRDARALIGWPELALPERELAALRRLTESLNYLGRSESWVVARVVDDRAVEWNCTPLEPGPVASGKEVVSVAGVSSPESFAGRAFELPARGKAKARRLPWLEALTWGSAETIAASMNRPPAMEPIFYVRAADALDARPTPRRATSSRVVEVVRFAAESRVRVPITEALRIGEQMHLRLMGSLRKVLRDDELTTTFSGREADGRPARGHRHISILPLDEDGDGYIDAVLVTSPTALSPEEQLAVDRLRPVERRSGHSLVVTPIAMGRTERMTTLSSRVISATPFAPLHHWRLKRDGDFDIWLSRQFAKEAEQRGLPRIIEVRRVPPRVATQRRFRWLDFRRARKGDAPQPVYGLDVVFAEPVRTPFSVGYASHFGLGCFVAA